MHPQNDAFAEILGSSFVGTAESAGEETTVVSPAFPTRREVRASQDAASGNRASRRKSRATVSRARRVAPVEVATPAYVLPAAAIASKQPKKKRFKALVTMLAVGGLFTSAGLPAYAMSTTASGESISTALTANAMSVSEDVKVSKENREEFSATTPADLAQQRSDSAKDANYVAYMASGARELGDDYPYFSELSNNQGGGLSPLNYFYRECVDFVAWRLNRDAGSTTAPYVFDWHYLTPSGGNASQWAYNWQSHGWPTGTTPKAGAVAWFNGNHVAYVNRVNDDGTVLLEEYNYSTDHLYGQRTIPADQVALYLYAPPLP